jgi:hypothetical protein
VNPIYAEFEALGVVEVRRRICSHEYADGKLAHVMNWLDLKDREATSVRDELVIALAQEAKALATSANAAAKDATSLARVTDTAVEESIRLARRANVTALIAAIAGIAALIVSVAFAMKKIVL